jgi:peptidoglycan/xylan/chitin deacetylase (PgdA/CDA1 family)
MPLQPSKILECIFPTIIWHGPQNDNAIYLTFDDGPDSNATPHVLDILRKQNVRATFFLRGSHISGTESVVEQIFQDRHLIANHSFTHRKLGWCSSLVIQNEVQDTEQIFQTNHWTYYRLFRPPFGHFRPGMESLLRRMNYRMVMWSIMPGDFRPLSSEQLLTRTLRKLKAGAIIVLHDHSSYPDTMLTMLPKLLSEIENRGLVCKDLDEIPGLNLTKVNP